MSLSNKRKIFFKINLITWEIFFYVQANSPCVCVCMCDCVCVCVCVYSFALNDVRNFLAFKNQGFQKYFTKYIYFIQKRNL